MHVMPGRSGKKTRSPPRLVNVYVKDDERHEREYVSWTPIHAEEDKEESCGDNEYFDRIYDASATEPPPTIVTSPMSSTTRTATHDDGASGMADSAASSDDSDYSDGSMLGFDAGGDGYKTMEVTITVLSLHGVVAAKKKSPRKNKISRGKQERHDAKKKPSDDEMATVVASFSVSKDGAFSTHVPSLPASVTSESGGSNHGGSGEAISRPAFRWPGTGAGDKDDVSDGALSTLRFQRRFVREESGFTRFVPQTCPIDLSVSRNGRMVSLGKANLIVNGEETGEAFTAVPALSRAPPTRKTGSIRGSLNESLRQVKNMQQSASKRQGQRQRMVGVEGDAYRFRLESPVLRVMVSARDPDLDAIAEWNKRENDGSRCPSVESELQARRHTPERQPADSYYGVNHCIAANSDALTLPQKLARSEQTNEKLRTELADARRLSARQRTENERLGMKLEVALHNAEALLNELDAIKAEKVEST